MYHMSAQGVDERMINVYYYYYYHRLSVRQQLRTVQTRSQTECASAWPYG